MAALLIGVAGGFLAANGVRRYRLTRNSGPTVAELLQRYVHTSTNGVVLLNRFGDVVLHNPRPLNSASSTSNGPTPAPARPPDRPREPARRPRSTSPPRS